MKKTILLALALAACGAHLPAQVPSTLNYQGRILQNGEAFEGTGHFVFAVYEGPILLWTNQFPVQDPLPDPAVAVNPSAAMPLPVRNGIFSARLGEGGANNAPVDKGVFLDFGDTARTRSEVRLKVWFSANAAGPYHKLNPDITFASVPYAQVAAVAEVATVAEEVRGGAVVESLLQQGVDLQLSSSPVSKALATGGFARELVATDLGGGVFSHIYRYSNDPVYRMVLATGSSPGLELVDGQSTPLDLGVAGSQQVSKVLQVRNIGNRDLTDLAASLDGAHASEFSAVLGDTTVPPGGTTTLTLTGNKVEDFGFRSAAVHIGATGLSNPFDVSLAKSSPPWIRLVNGNVNTNEAFTAVLHDPSSGDLFVAGTYAGSTASLNGTVLPNTGSGTNQDVFLARISPRGDLLWLRSLPATGTSADDVHSLEIGPDNSVYMAGDFSGTMTLPESGTLVSAGGTDGFVAKFGMDGTFRWARRFGGTSADSARRLVASSGSLILAGQFLGLLDLNLPGDLVFNSSTVDLFVTSLDPTNGDALWAATIGDERPEYLADAVARPGGGIYLSLFRGNALHLAAFDGAGYTVGQNPSTVEIARTSEGGALAVSDNILWVAGSEVGGGYIRKLSTDGKEVLLGTAANSMPGFKPLELVFDGHGNLMVAGTFTGNATLYPGSNPVALQSRGGADLFLAKFTTNDLALVWANSGGSEENDLSNARVGLALDANGHLAIAGSTRGFSGKTFSISNRSHLLQVPLSGSLTNSAGFLVRCIGDGRPNFNF